MEDRTEALLVSCGFFKGGAEMIKVNMIVKRQEDRYETEITFDSSESKPEAVEALTAFFRRKVYEEPGLASRYRENMVQRGDVLTCTVKMNFRTRRDIADSMRTADVGKLSKYTVEFERAAREYVETACKGENETVENDIRLVEPQKVVFFRSRKITAILAAFVLFIWNLADSFIKLKIGIWGMIAIILGIPAVLELIEIAFGQPGGIRVAEKRGRKED